MEKNNETMYSTMQFKEYRVIKLEFKDSPVSSNAEKHYELKPQFMKHIDFADEKNFAVTLGCKIEPKEGYEFPFHLEVVIQGSFVIDEKEEAKNILVEQNSVAILFPYLRSTVSSVTNVANRPPVVLPTLNIVKLFEQTEQQAEEKNQK